MKFTALRNFAFKDKKTGQEQSITKGETFDSDDLEMINSLILDFRICPADSSLLPDVSWYKVLHNFSENFEGENFKGEVKGEVRLKRGPACYFLARGFVTPSNEDTWTPYKTTFPGGNAPKRMFDIDEAQ